MVSFSKPVTGQAGGPALFMTGELRVSGDLLFAQQILRFFDQPEA
ncbi:MAG: SCP2 sterol-binding domain-containing protein [Actinobacteria bacterium]|nr:SCP2 sterol-binding domain-containing protein [Actinomycetota bacterium]